VVDVLKKNGVQADTAYSRPVNQYEFYRNYLAERQLPPVWGQEEFPNFNKQTSSLFIIKLSSKQNDSTFERMYEALVKIDGNG
jgi:hypothetical protein